MNKLHVIISISLLMFSCGGNDDEVSNGGIIPNPNSNLDVQFQDISSVVFKNSAFVQALIVNNSGDSILHKGFCYSEEVNPTLDDFYCSPSFPSLNIGCTLGGLNPATTYNYRIFAIGLLDTAYSANMTFTTEDVVIDVDGNAYRKAQIGSQTWLSENLRVTRYNNLDTLKISTTRNGWIGYWEEVFILENHPFGQAEYYYSWKVADVNKNICPSGWHIPSELEWQELLNEVGDYHFLQDPELGWNEPRDTVLTSYSDFNMLGAGYKDCCSDDPNHFSIGSSVGFLADDELINNGKSIIYGLNVIRLPAGIFWSREIIDSPPPLYHNLGLSIRCIQD